MTAAARIIGWIEALVDRTGQLAAWLILPVVGLLFLQIPMRELAHFGHNEVNDLGQLCHACVFMLGCAYAMRWDAHVRVDIFYGRMGARGKALVNLLGTLLLLMPWLAIVARESLPVVVRSWRAHEAFAETYTPGYFLLKAQLLAFAALVGLQALANVLRDARTLLATPAAGAGR